MCVRVFCRPCSSDTLPLEGKHHLAVIDTTVFGPVCTDSCSTPSIPLCEIVFCHDANLSYLSNATFVKLNITCALNILIFFVFFFSFL